MTRKRMIKLLMGFYCNRNNAVRLANKCDGDLSHEAVFYHLLEEFYRDYLRELERFVIKGDPTGEVVVGVDFANESDSTVYGDFTGAVAGMVGSVYE